MRNKLKKILTISALIATGSLSANAGTCLEKSVPAAAESLEKPLAIGEKALVLRQICSLAKLKTTEPATRPPTQWN